MSVDSFANIFSHYEGYLFVYFIVSFATQKVLSFIRSQMLIFVFISITLGGGSKKDLAVIYVKECSSYVFLKELDSFWPYI